MKHRDILAIRRKLNQRAFLAIDLLVTICIPGCVWPVIVQSVEWILGATEGYDVLEYLGNGFAWAFTFSTTITVLALSMFYVLYIGIASLVNKLSGRPFLPSYPSDNPLSSAERRGKQYFLGPRRTPAERAAVINHVSNFLFQRSVFRKHT